MHFFVHVLILFMSQNSLPGQRDSTGGKKLPLQTADSDFLPGSTYAPLPPATKH